MQSMTLASMAVLAPALALLLAAALVGGLAVPRISQNVARGIGLAFTAAALGMAVRLWLVSRSRDLYVALPVPSGGDASATDVHVDPIAGLILISILTVGLATLDEGAAQTSAIRVAAVLFTLTIAAVFVLSTSLLVIAILWTALIFAPAVWSIAGKEVGEAISWASLAVIVAPILALSGAILGAGHGGTALLTVEPSSANLWAALLLGIVGLVGAGLTPLKDWLLRPTRMGLTTMIADGILPLVGFYLALRAMGLLGADRPVVLGAVFIGVGLWCVGDAARQARQADSFLAVIRAAGRGDSGLAVIALGIATRPAVAAAVFLLVFGVLARTSARIARRDWLARLGWASMAGLPPLPGFVGRWLIVVAALGAGQWFLAIIIAVGAMVLTSAMFASASVRNDGDESLSFAEIALASTLLVGGLVPQHWLFSMVVPLTMLPELPSPAASRIAILLALLAVTLSSLTAVAVARQSPQLPRHRDVDDRLQDRSSDGVVRVAERVAELGRAVDARYNLPFGFLAVIVAVFALVR
jgi:multicomponent Na+:H+ antiporter subunit D